MRQQMPHLRAIQTAQARPELARDCPDNLFELVEKLMPTPLLVDNEPFTWRGHEYLVQPYKDLSVAGYRPDIPPDELEHHSFVWMCGAQVGKSVAAMLFMIWLALRFWGKYFGYFLPTADMAMIFSGDRFKPMATNIPQIAKIWGEDPTADEDQSGKKTDQKRVRSIGPSLVFFNSMAGKTSTESIPMLALVFDEVRRMLDSDMERAKERVSHSPWPMDFKISTAGYPDANIDRAFRASNQNKFHSACKCKDGVVLADVFPDCIGQKLDGVTPALKDLPSRFWVCPRCKEPIRDPRFGQWIAHAPDIRLTIGYHISQILSCRQNAESIYQAFIRATDITEFYNSKLGLPHISPEAQIVNLDILKATVNPDLRWALPTGRYPKGCAMGVDQMYGLNVATIRKRGPKDPLTGLHKSQLVHLEWIVDDDPWIRTAELMRQFDISCCVVDALPNANEAFRFAQAFPGRVFLADYSYEAQKGEDIAVWGDKPQDPNKKASKDTKEKHRVRISRYHAIEWNLKKYVARLKEQPNPMGLLMPVPDVTGRLHQTFICRDVFWLHLTKVARRKKVLDELQDKFKMVFENIGLDPHFLHADVYCELALTRIKSPEDVAFGAYRKKEESDGTHKWRAIEGAPNEFTCDDCGLSILVPPGSGQSPQDVAEKRGYKLCQPTTQ